MVSENVMSGACADFTQNAWRKDLCSNCQRSKAEHLLNQNGSEVAEKTNSPVPVKRKSLLINTGNTDHKDVVNVAKRNAALLLNASEKTGLLNNEDERTNQFIEISENGKDGKNVESEEKTLKPLKSVLVKKRRKRSSSKKSSVSIVEKEPDVIGEDGGYDNLFLDDVEDDDVTDSASEELSFTEEEREFVLLALENTLWNSDIRNLNGETNASKNTIRSKEFEDVKMISLWKIDRFATLRDVDKIIPKRYGTFPLRKPMGGKSKLEKMFSEKADNLQRSNSDAEMKAKESVENENNQYETNFFTFEKRRSRSASEMEYKPHTSTSNATPYKIINVTDIIDSTSSEGPELPAKENSEALADSSNHMDIFNSLDESVFDLDFDSDILENFNTNIDLDSSGAGMELVDLLNDVLARYSDGISIKGFEDQDLMPDGGDGEEGARGVSAEQLVESLRIPKGSLKSKEFEAKLVSLAANLDLSRKKGKRPAPRPPVSPPPEPGSKKGSVSTVTTELDSTKSSSNSSPADTLQNPPNFKMVPIGKSIVGNHEKPLSPKRTGDFHEDPVEVSKPKSENKSNKKGFTSFFKNILRRGKESPENSSEQVSESSLPKHSSSDNLQSENAAKDSKKDNGRSSPQFKAKVLPTTGKTSRTSIIMTASDNGQPEIKAESPKSKRKVLPSVEERADNSCSTADKEKASVEVTSAAVKPSVPLRPKPPPNPNKPCISPQLSQKDLSRSSPGREPARSSPGKDISRSSPGKDVSRSSPAKDTSLSSSSLNEVTTSTPVQERKNSLNENEKKSSLEREKPERASRTRKTSVEKEAKSNKENSTDEKEVPVVRRRAKSPKRFTAPPKPVKGVENRSSLFAKELEMRLSKNLDQSKVVMTTAPPSPPVKKDQVKNKEEDAEITKSPGSQPKVKAETKKPIEVDKVEVASQGKGKQESKKLSGSDQTPPVSKKTEQNDAETKEAKADNSNAETVSSSAPVEKIELPAKASSRRSFLGKLSNKKSRAPPRPPSSVKRAKSISENSQSGSELQPKKIDVSDISGPVLITPMTGGPVQVPSQVTRRNTISIVEDHSMVSGSSTSSGSTADKYDEWPDFSPIGSLENLYEPIVPKEQAPPPPQTSPAEIPPFTKSHMYDPPKATLMSQSLILPKTPIDGYLEPVRASNTKVDKVPVAVTQTVVKMDDNVIIPDEEPEIDEEKRKIVASQPIYEEINGNGVKVESFIERDNLAVNVSDALTTSELNLPPVSPSPSHGAMSSESEPSSACSTLSRPKPLPRKRSNRSVSTHSEHAYIAMNRLSITSALNESQLRDMLNQLTSMNLQTLRDIYTQYETKFNKDIVNLNVSGSGPLKWADFDIYGKPVHSSERCIVYNVKLKMTTINCQLMLLHTRPELMSTGTQHPSLLKPTVIFSDAIPFTYLTEDFIKTSQLLHNLQNSTNQSNFAKCFVAIGQFDITDNLTNHMSSLRHGNSAMLTLEDQMETVLFCVLQMLSAISYCLDQGFCLGDAEFRDVFLLSCGANCQGNIIAFLPHQRSHDQAESVFYFLEKYLAESVACCGSEFGKYCAGVQKIQKMIQCHRLDILSLVRSYIEFLLWGPSEESWQGGVERQSSLEPKLSMWLEKERAALVHLFAKNAPRTAHKYLVKDFYRMKFLLKSSAVSLSECVRTHISY